MQKTTMSITRALATLKAQKAEIDQFFSQAQVFVGVTTGTSGKDTNYPGADVAKVTAAIQSTNDKINGLLARQVAIRQAINVSNMNTMVVVNGKTISVAEAVVLKGTQPQRIQLLNKLRESYNSNATQYNKIRTDVDKRIDTLVAGSIGEETPAEEKAAVSASVRETQEKLMGPSLIDPNNIVEQIEALSKEINFIKNELDYTLSESNTTTVIEVEM